MKVVIVGAGIIGITSAIRLLEMFPRAEITIITEEYSPNTTSDVSAGYWKPLAIEGYNMHLVEKWSMYSYHRWVECALASEANETGVQLMPTYALEKTEKSQKYFYSDKVSQYRELAAEELKSICVIDEASEVRSGYSFVTTTTTVCKFIPYQMRILASKGVRFVKKRLSKLEDFVKSKESEGFDYIINCVGLGACQFCDDKNMRPIRGQVIRVRAPWVKTCIFLNYEHTYILPQTDTVVLGGTYEYDEWSMEPNEDSFQKILDRCCRFVPSLKNAEIVSKKTGLRPFRNGGVRLELEEFVIEDRNNIAKVVHNYGHAGIGVILSWGCADEVCQLIMKDLNLEVSSDL